jgi:hypothetical protein
MAYRWEKASGGEVPSGAYEKGHAFGGDDDGNPVGPMWVARTLPDADGAVRVGYVERGKPAVFGKDRVDEYEVLLDRGTWKPNDQDENPPPDRIACGREAGGTAVYAAVTDQEQWGYWPKGIPEGGSSQWWPWYLVEAEGPEPGAYPWEQLYDHNTSQQGGPAEEPAAADEAVARPVVSALDLRKEVVVISNAGTAEVDLGGWKIRDDSKRKPYVFRAGTILGPGASVRLRSGPSALQTGEGELTWTTSLVWNDSGDTAFLENPDGEVVSTSRD